MEAGRELDTLIAVKVMGWTYSESCGVYYPPGLHPENNVVGHTIPAYSTDIAAAWQVVEKFRRGDMKAEINALAVAACVELEITDYPDPLGDCLCRIYSPLCAKVETVAHEMPHAICLAALKAVGYKEDRS